MSQIENNDGEMADDDNETANGIQTNCVHLTLRILFSTPGLCVLVILYTLLGAVIFPFFESPIELHNTLTIIKSREDCLRELWTITEKLNVLYERNWTMLVHEQLRRFEISIIKATKGGLNETMVERSRWSFTEAFLYSLTLITTIGYGSLTPRTHEGKIITMAYAIIGVPLMLMCLSNLGRALARVVQRAYRTICIRPSRQQHQRCATDDNDEQRHNATQQYQTMPNKNNENQDCNLCHYNDVCKESNVYNANERNDAYHLLRNSPTKSILSNSQHSTPQRTVCLNHPLNQPQSPNKPCTPTHSNHRHITTTIPPNQHFIQIRPTNIDNVAINVQAPTHPNHLHCPVINSVQYDFPTTMPSATHPIYVQQQEANGRFCLVPATSLSLSLPFPPPPVAAIQTMPTSAPQANPIKSAALHSYQFIQMPSNQAILLDKSQRNSHPSMNNQQFHTATVHGIGRSKFLPKPLPQEINMLLTECDMNCYPDSSGKAITTMESSTSVAKSSDTKASIIQSDTSSQSITANNSSDSYNGKCMDTLDDDDDDDDNRTSYVHGTSSPSRIPLIALKHPRTKQISFRDKMHACDTNGERYDPHHCMDSMDQNNHHCQLQQDHHQHYRHHNQSRYESNNYTNYGEIETDHHIDEPYDEMGYEQTQVPIIVIVIILAIYICIGTVIFSIWENWSFVDGAYFCFVTLSTIGFADMVPLKTFYGSNVQLLVCSIYLTVGLILVTMSYTLLETQLVCKCRRIFNLRLRLRKDSPRD